MARSQARDAAFRTPSAGLPLPVRAANVLAGPLARRIDLSSDAIVKRALKGLPPGAETAPSFARHSTRCATRWSTKPNSTHSAASLRVTIRPGSCAPRSN